MNKKILNVLFFITLFLGIIVEGHSQGTPMPMPPYNAGLGSYNYVYNTYWYTAPRDFWIVRLQELGGWVSGNQSIEIYRLSLPPAYSGQLFYNEYWYGAQTYRLTPLWSIRNFASTGIININQGTAYPGGTVQDIFCTAGTRYLISGNMSNYYNNCYYGSPYNTNVGGTTLTMYPCYMYNGYQMYYNWSYYGYLYTSSYYMGRTQIYYMLPCYIYVTQTSGGTIAPGTTYGPFKPGLDVNLNYTVTPTVGKHIVDVTINGASVGSITRPVHTQHFGVVNTTQTLSATYGNRIVATGYGCFLNPTGTSYFITGANPSYVITPFPGATVNTITATGAISGAISIPVLNGGQGQTIALGQPGYPFGSINEDWTLDVVCVMNLFTTVEPHGTMNPLGSSDIPYGTLYPVQIIPDINYKVNHLYVDGFDVLDPTQPGYPHPGLDLSAYPIITFNIDMSYSHTMHATFYAYEITPEVIGMGGTITPGDPVRVYEHAQYPFVIEPDLDYHIDSIKAINLSNAEITVFGNIPQHGSLQVLFRDIMNDWRLQAQFTIDRYNVVVKDARIIEGGKIFPTGSLDNSSTDGLIIVNSGTDLNFSITPDVGWNIKDVILDVQSQGNVSSLFLSTIRADHEVEAQFQRIAFNITATAGNHGTITMDGWELPIPANGEYPVFYGENARFVITPDHGYKLDQVSVDGATVNPEPEHIFNYITGNHSITASFVPMNRYTITATAGTGGTVSPSGAVSVVEGDNQTFNITPNAGYEISDVLIDGVSQGKIIEHTFNNVNADHTIEIIFNPIVTFGLQCSLDATQVVSGQPFSITLTCIDQNNQQPVNPPAAVNVTLAAAQGSQGTLSGTLQGTIPANDNKVTISGIVYTNNSGEANVQLVSSASGMPDCMLTANILASEPANQDADVKFDNVSAYSSKDGSTALSQVTVSWTNGDGNKHLVVMKATDPIGTPDLPVDGVGYPASPSFGTSGNEIGGAFAIFNGAGNTLTVTNLVEGTLYYARVFGFNGNADLANYNTGTGAGNPSSFLVAGAEDTYTANGFQVTNISPNPAFVDIKFDFTVGTPSAYTIEVVDLQGRTVASYCSKKFYESGNYQVSIPVSKLSSGSYILKIYNGTDFAYQVFTIVR
ncbi:MAG: T9SS type A sorting domain-containing protein [Ignavibacteriae bacterium]|nr:T9SS type A sorting domain-containing protein [Ignavibacteriota bacterium]